ncbi:MAG: hypothetical protein ACD_16C00213G0020 [uncultured bacterium]|nr:MAG: hypothetical protein ACD_16C00213G0020 [uncultured bacterium]OFW69789.1 MAG: adenylate kinase [Alphaproteobacteria bacterium GWC2_42_16]OFW74389.1 MAG: adenylate kinase [Alphaproteobacteria bacterium GWA2_41_27]OFW82513.1 MAG: adenylate kinase [Alphaproteobacteria bacterium RIFCSPHIGHO2_12_FULL_42_100]OFW85101.1 MAG: adenylate kinase [Alphaproteobacteria bacterium RBG_16_42_14]OFW91623.1 MAG: adenylate kinase [Alphaproteobacteria bacterium RIFCSPHIGHO2_12_42_13]OFW92563.1 MAG: adenyla
MNLVLFGPPGAGKGTQARLIQDRHHLELIATGEILRQEIKKKTPLGLQVEHIMAEGKYPSDDIILAVFKKRLSQVKDKGVILDGLPRTMNQAKKIAETFKELGHEIDAVIQLTVDEDKLIERLSSRVTCEECGRPYPKDFPFQRVEACSKCGSRSFSRRPDDEPEAVRTRFKVYNEQTKPLLNYYAKQGLLKVINGMKSIEEVNQEIEALLEEMQVLTRKSGCLYSAQDI